MKKLTLIAATVGSLAGASLTTVPAVAREAFSFSFNTGDVAFAYSDGYWDNNRQWHGWRNAREAREYRAHYAKQYRNTRHTRERNQGWRGDQDRDGVPNSRDRDRDGVSNNRDDRPNNRDDRPNNPRRN